MTENDTTVQTDAREQGARRLLLTVTETARILGISRSMTYSLNTAGELEVVHIGRCARVPYAAAIEFVDRLRQPRTQDA
jgi:excisionase family DNA binding protein